MENVSRLSAPLRLTWTIEIYPYLYDHHLEGKTVYPAAEALITLARAVKTNFPRTDIKSLAAAYFPRFLSIPEDAQTLAASVAIGADEAGGITAALLTSVKSKTANISRTVEHARVTFTGHALKQKPAYPFCLREKLTGECINVPAAAIYRELVPFGRAYQNISGDLTVARDGALASLSGGNTEADDDLLGSPFPFDAALHMACVWIQRFHGIVALPVGLAKRNIYQKTKKQSAYLGRIIPVTFTAKQFFFDAWICDLQGAICEVITGIQMQDLSSGRMRPPAWIKAMTAE